MLEPIGQKFGALTPLYPLSLTLQPGTVTVLLGRSSRGGSCKVSVVQRLFRRCGLRDPRLAGSSRPRPAPYQGFAP